MKKQVLVLGRIAGEEIERFQANGEIFTAYQIAAANCENQEFKQLFADWYKTKYAQNPRELEKLTEQLTEYEIIVPIDTANSIAERLFINRVKILAYGPDFKEYGEPRLKLIHSSRRDLFLKLLSLGYNLKESSVLLARLEIEAAKLNEANISDWTPDRILELIHSLKVR